MQHKVKFKSYLIDIVFSEKLKQIIMKKLILIVAVMFAFCTFTFAQDKAKPEKTKQEQSKSEPFNKWEIGFNAGVGNFSGEYNMHNWGPYNDWDSSGQFGFGAFVKKNFSHVFAMEFGWNHNSLIGNLYHGFDSSFPNSEFKTITNEYDVNTVWNINNLVSKNKFDRKLYLFAKVGVGATSVNNKTGLTYSDSKLEFPTVPLGAGIAVRLSDKVRLNLGTQWSWIHGDRLDGSVTHPTTNNPNPSTNGTKMYTYAGLSFTLGKKKQPAPVVEAPKPEPKPEPKPQPKPVVKEKPAVIGNAYKVYFAFDKWNLDSKATADLDRLAKDMNENPTVNVNLKSHTDSRGPASYNMKLSEKRGKSVIDYLNSKGISNSRINAQAFGETQLVNKCKDGVPCTKAEHALNRRTETIVIE